MGAGGHPSERTIFLLAVPSLSVLIVRCGVQDSPVICLKGQEEWRRWEERRRTWREVGIRPFVSCRGAGARLGATRLTFVCLTFSARGSKDAYHLCTAPPHPYRRAVVYKRLSFTDTIICSINKLLLSVTLQKLLLLVWVLTIGCHPG